VWKPTVDKLIFKMIVNLSAAEGKGQKVDEDLTATDIGISHEPV